MRGSEYFSFRAWYRYLVQVLPPRPTSPFRSSCLTIAFRTLVQQNPGFNPNPQNAIPSIFAPGSAILGVLFAPIGGAIGLFVAAAIQQLLVRFVVGANNAGFLSTFKVAAYTQVTSLVNWIPIVGPLVALYGLYLSIVGIREVHGTTTGKAALVVLIPFAVFLVVALIVVAAAGIAVLSQR
jgi:hypothetical protein